MAVFHLCRRRCIFRIGLVVVLAWFTINVLIIVMYNMGLDANNASQLLRRFRKNTERSWTYKLRSNISKITLLGQFISSASKQEHKSHIRLLEQMQEEAKDKILITSVLQNTVYKQIDEKEPNKLYFMSQAASSEYSKFLFHRRAPGELGKPVVIDKDKLSPDEKRRFDDGWKDHTFNQYVSDMISVHRSLPDVRDAQCKSIQYHNDLPDTSVVVIFFNEAWSTLLRTVHSVLDRSPPHLLNELILVDDCSTFEHLHQQLQDYMNKLTKVKLIRSERRSGLIHARLLGVEIARGQVITFLDSHCEVTEGWLEPLLDKIAVSTTNVITPVIDVIDANTLEYIHGPVRDAPIGGFDWNLQFTWHAIPEYKKRQRKTDNEPIRSPTMPGGLFAINKAYFEKLGLYDPGMDAFWGGENLELSFKIWMCGGTLEIVPCSHVGHLFRSHMPYSLGTYNVNKTNKNPIRLAEGDYGNVSDRKALRTKLNCKSFDWFIKNIYPELYIPDVAVAYGEIRNKAMTQCLDSSVVVLADGKSIQMWPCDKTSSNQYWRLTTQGEIRRDEGCFDFAGDYIVIRRCHSMKGNQEWIYGMDGTLKHTSTNLCMELSEAKMTVEMAPCTGVVHQTWLWQKNETSSDNSKVLI